MVAACLVFLLVPVSLLAQGASRAGLRGTVTDSEGAPQAQAQISVLHVPSGFTASTFTNTDGRYLMTGLRAGSGYRIQVEQLGFTTIERTEVTLLPGETVVLDFELSTQPLALEEVRVQTQADPRFSRSRTGSATLVDEEAIRAHPTVERDFIQMAEISPVVSKTDDGGLSISGQNARYNAVLIDGALHQDVFGSSAGGVPGSEARARALPMDAVQDFQVEVAPFDVRQSGFTGGMLNAVTKSGTNEWHGSLTAEFRDESYFGPLVVDGTDVTPLSYHKRVVAGTVGGPVFQDRLHLFVAAEIETRTEPPLGYSIGRPQPGKPRLWPRTRTALINPLHTRVSPDSAVRMAEILRDVYYQDAGNPGVFSLDNASGNLFARVDWQASDAHSVTAHLNYVSADRDMPPNRTPLGLYEFSSSGYGLESRTLGMKAQLNSRLTDRLENELMVNVQRTRDGRDPVGEFPQVDVTVISEFESTLIRRDLRAGAGYLDQRADLDQDVIQLSDALTWARGDLTTIFGAGLDIFRFRHTSLPGSMGYYRFDSLEDLEDNRPSYYEVNLLQDGVSDPTSRFTVLQPGLLIQNEHRFPDGLIMYYGIRADMPMFPTAPERNAAIEETFDRRTDQLPSGHLLISPRLGVNWQSDLQYMTQVRGGGGVFTGRLPYVWLSNAYASTGLQSVVLSCHPWATPAMHPLAPPEQCADGTTVETGGARNVVLFNPDFRYPRELKTSLAIDQRMPLGLTASAEVLLVQTMSQVIINELNLVQEGPKDTDYTKIFGQRTQYGDPIAPTGYVQRQHLDGYGHVLEMGNENSSGFAHAITLGLEQRFGRSVALSGSYSFNHSDDVQSLESGDALVNFASNPIGYDPNMMTRRPSAFNRPWKAVGTMQARLPERWTGGTELSLLYIAEAGHAYSYVYADDINGDGYPGPGVQLDASNDLLYVPENVSDIRASFGTYMLFSDLIEKEPCLKEARGMILQRNACRAPESHRLDLKVTQPVTLGRYQLQLTGSVLNVLNLIDDEWGRVVYVPPLVPILALGQRETRPIGYIIPDSRPSLNYVGPVARDPVENRLRAALPHTVLVPESQWQAQVGLRLTF